jgi:hypothetical protein
VKRAARVAAVSALAGLAAVGGASAGARADTFRPSAVPAAVPLLVPGRVLRPRPDLRPRGELRARSARRLSSLPVLEKRATRLAWRRAFVSARSYARRRLGRVAFAFVDDTGRVRSWHGRRTFYSASLVKAMLLVAYLRQRGVRDRHLSAAAQRLLDPMIRRSDNDAASAVRNIVGNAGLARLARRAGMRWFASAVSWGDTHLAAVDQAVFFYGIDRFVPRLHRPYARLLLSHIIPEQRWGIPEVAPHGVRVFFKGGWRPSVGGWIENQSALVVGPGGRRMALSVLTDHDRSDGYGHETIRGIARRLTRVMAAG